MRPETTNRAKTWRRGTHRIVAPAETLARVRPFVRAMGITRIGNITGLDRVGVPTVMVCRPNSRSIAVSQGKGVDLDAAKASGVMEAVEAYHAETIAAPARWASAATLGREGRLPDLEALPRLHGRTLDPDQPILWLQAHDLADGEPLWLPYELVSADFTLPQPPGSGWFAATTNGLASGNTLAEAILHALCEVIERDATTLWELGGAAKRDATGLDPAQVDDADVDWILGRFAAARIAVGVWETTTEVGVPAFVCLITGRDDGADPEIGAGCHPSPVVALLRALTEAAQARAAFIAGARDDLLPAIYALTARRERAERARVWLDAARAVRRFAAIDDLAGASVEADLDAVRRRLAAAGFATAGLVDLTRSEFDIPVARVVVPGLEAPRRGAGWTPGRRARALLRAAA